ncbi:MAG: class I SAM-dependent methyltransferase [Mycobacteriales bacterium]
MRTPSWRPYLRAYHDRHPGITEGLLRRCTPDPYGWLLQDLGLEGCRVLDLACGSAPLFPELRAGRYLGVDLSEGELAAAVAAGRGPVVRADACRLPLPDSCVDVVVCSMALQVLTPLAQVLAEVRRVLAPGGVLVAMIPVSRPLTLADRGRYARLLWRLRRARLGYANGRVPATLAREGWTVTSRQSRRFGYPVVRSQDGGSLVDAFYLPGVADHRQEAAARLVSGWTGTELGIPLQRLLARPVRHT